eukprot:766468-Hanusia_phi.AAC.2
MAETRLARCSEQEEEATEKEEMKYKKRQRKNEEQQEETYDGGKQMEARASINQHESLREKGLEGMIQTKRESRWKKGNMIHTGLHMERWQKIKINARLRKDYRRKGADG